jgi:hypothetical protein
MRHTTTACLFFLFSCRAKVDPTDTGDAGSTDDTGSDVTDADGDGSPEGEDCDDDDASVSPDATEVPYDGVDNDCDPATPDDDLDGDGALVATDCDDENPDIHPDATEACNDVDDDCDGDVDESIGDLWYLDVDGDGFGDPDTGVQDCDGFSWFVDNGDDCDDTSSEAFPGGTEVCDELDNDCDGTIDEDVTTTFYADLDGDGWGDAGSTVQACAVATGFSPDAGDCDDTDPSISPSATEICNGLDDDCDGDLDESDAVDAATWYADDDGDGYGDASASSTACDQPTGAVADATDCDDTDSALNPDTLWYRDADSDTYGAADTTTASCLQPSGWVADATDCDDADATSSPAGTEVCDGADNNCDGTIDEGVTTAWTLDYDADGYGDDSTEVLACSAPTALYVSTGGDCDDTDVDYNPGATPGCDGEDYDCDGSVDSDADGDGYADQTCGGDDCDDTDASVYPDVGGGCALGGSCLEILDAGRSGGDGTYSIDPDGFSTGEDPFDVTCDMTTDGGGWTEITGALLQVQDWVAFTHEAGSGSPAIGWYDTDSFWLSPEGSSATLRATATLPFTFTEWIGEWTGTGDTTGSHQDDMSSRAWGALQGDWQGHLKFGTDQDTSKVGGEWGSDWNYTSPYYQVWEWTQESVTESDVLRWEVGDQSDPEDVVFTDISIWVR